MVIKKKKARLDPNSYFIAKGRGERERERERESLLQVALYVKDKERKILERLHYRSCCISIRQQRNFIADGILLRRGRRHRPCCGWYFIPKRK